MTPGVFRCRPKATRALALGAWLMLACGSFAQSQIPGDHPSVPLVPTALAIVALRIDPARSPVKLVPRPSADGMAVFRLLIDADGTVLHREMVSAPNPAAEGAEATMEKWTFVPLAAHGVRSRWWTYLGVCYSNSWKMFLPCIPPPPESSRYTAGTLPIRIYPVVREFDYFQNDFPGTPLVRVKGRHLDYPVIALGAKGEGIIGVRVALDVNGKVTQVHSISGNPILIGAASHDIKSWQFAPVKFMDQPVDAEIEFWIGYSLASVGGQGLAAPSAQVTRSRPRH